MQTQHQRWDGTQSNCRTHNRYIKMINNDLINIIVIASIDAAYTEHTGMDRYCTLISNSRLAEHSPHSLKWEIEKAVAWSRDFQTVANLTPNVHWPDWPDRRRALAAVRIRVPAALSACFSNSISLSAMPEQSWHKQIHGKKAWEQEEITKTQQSTRGPVQPSQAKPSQNSCISPYQLLPCKHS